MCTISYFRKYFFIVKTFNTLYELLYFPTMTSIPAFSNLLFKLISFLFKTKMETECPLAIKYLEKKYNKVSTPPSERPFVICRIVIIKKRELN